MRDLFEINLRIILENVSFLKMNLFFIKIRKNTQNPYFLIVIISLKFMTIYLHKVFSLFLPLFCPISNLSSRPAP